MIIHTFLCDTVVVCLSLRQIKIEALVVYRSEVSNYVMVPSLVTALYLIYISFTFFVHINNLENLQLEINIIIIPFLRNKRACSFGIHSRYCQFTLFDCFNSIALNSIG